MGSYLEINGDLLHLFDKGMFDAIGHGANCFCRMKSGIAGQISKKFKGAAEADNETEPGDKRKLGSLTYWDHPNRSRLYNLYTQYNYGRQANNLYLDYGALERALKHMRENLRTKLSQGNGFENKLNRPMEIGFPQIGCGLAQGNWEKVKGIIQKVFENHDITIVIYEWHMPEMSSGKLF